MPTKVGSFKKNWHSNHLRDQFQRNSLERYNSFNEEDLIMISDIDEIPNPKRLKNLILKINMCFLQKNFQSKIKSA